MEISNGVVDLYGTLNLPYGATVDEIRKKIKEDFKNGRIITDQQKSNYNEILEYVSMPDKKDSYDQIYLESKVGDKLLACKIWRNQRFNFVDYYNILNLSPDASTREIKRSYRKLALLYHPDKQHSPAEDTHEIFAILADAISILDVVEARNMYNIVHQNFYKGQNFLDDEEPKQEEKTNGNQPQTEKKRIFIKNYAGSYKELRIALQKYGQIVKVSNIGRKMYIAKMKNQAGALAVIKNLQGIRIGRHKIKVCFYMSLEQVKEAKEARSRNMDDGDSDVEIVGGSPAFYNPTN